MYVLIAETEAGRDLPRIEIYTVDDDTLDGLPEDFDLEELRELMGIEGHVLGYTDNIQEVKDAISWQVLPEGWGEQ